LSLVSSEVFCRGRCAIVHTRQLSAVLRGTAEQDKRGGTDGAQREPKNPGVGTRLLKALGMAWEMCDGLRELGASVTCGGCTHARTHDRAAVCIFLHPRFGCGLGLWCGGQRFFFRRTSTKGPSTSAAQNLYLSSKHQHPTPRLLTSPCPRRCLRLSPWPGQMPHCGNMSGQPFEPRLCRANRQSAACTSSVGVSGGAWPKDERRGCGVCVCVPCGGSWAPGEG
jgi:hypothetical protein